MNNSINFKIYIINFLFLFCTGSLIQAQEAEQPAEINLEELAKFMEQFQGKQAPEQSTIRPINYFPIVKACGISNSGYSEYKSGKDLTYSTGYAANFEKFELSNDLLSDPAELFSKHPLPYELLQIAYQPSLKIIQNINYIRKLIDIVNHTPVNDGVTELLGESVDLVKLNQDKKQARKIILILTEEIDELISINKTLLPALSNYLDNYEFKEEEELGSMYNFVDFVKGYGELIKINFNSLNLIKQTLLDTNQKQSKILTRQYNDIKSYIINFTLKEAISFYKFEKFELIPTNISPELKFKLNKSKAANPERFKSLVSNSRVKNPAFRNLVNLIEKQPRLGAADLNFLLNDVSTIKTLKNKDKDILILSTFASRYYDLLDTISTASNESVKYQDQTTAKTIIVKENEAPKQLLIDNMPPKATPKPGKYKLVIGNSKRVALNIKIKAQIASVQESIDSIKESQMNMDLTNSFLLYITNYINLNIISPLKRHSFTKAVSTKYSHHFRYKKIFPTIKKHESLIEPGFTNTEQFLKAL